MFVDPNVRDSIEIRGTTHHFTEATNAPGIIYAEIGRKAKVYRLISNGQPFALKAFKPKYRIPETVVNTPQIARYQDVPGLAVAGRTIIAPEQYPQIIQTYPAFAYSVLMPWVEGKSWFNYVTGKLSLTQAESLHLARALVNAVCELERRDLAHCDLSSSNFIFSSDLSHVELIDIEDMFGHGLLPPKENPRGTGGYAPAWIKEHGVWEVAADRFSTGILVSEILGWQFEEVREASAGDAYFAEGEFGNKSRRFRLLSERLEQIHPELANLFKTVWYAESLEECPKITDWKRIFGTIPLVDLGALQVRSGEMVNTSSEISNQTLPKSSKNVRETPAPKWAFLAIILALLLTFGVCALGIGWLIFGSQRSSAPPTSSSASSPVASTSTPTTVIQFPISTTPSFVQVAPINTSVPPTLTDPLQEHFIDPGDFARWYFTAVWQNRNYDYLWTLATTSFQNHASSGGFDEYVSWWSSVDRVDIGSINVLQNDGHYASIKVVVTFHLHSGRALQDRQYDYDLIYDTSRQTWMFDYR